MRKKPLRTHALLALLLAIVWTGSVQAVTCSLTSGAVAFGAYDPTSSASVLTTGSVTVTCNGKFHAVLSVGLGNGTGASYSGGRKMTRAGGGGNLIYNLYADAARTHVLGDGTGGSVTIIVDEKKGAYSQAIWGRIRGSQSAVLSGRYGDTVIATISY